MTFNNHLQTRLRPAASTLLFGVLLLVLCGWVLSLPVFPSQDGPAHRFYAGVLSAELSHEPYNGAYVIRRPVPPYAAEDYLLAFASRAVDIDFAEKLFVCLVLVVTGVGVRLCCRYMGPGGPWASLFVIPLLLHWPLMMGYMNYSLGLGLLLTAFGVWLAAASTTRSAWRWAAFIVLVLLLTFTHPVPLLMLAVLCGYDLMTCRILSRLQSRSTSSAKLSQVLALGFVVLALAVPVLNSDGSRSSVDLRQSIFRGHAYISDLLLRGVSPFYRHSHALTVNAYRATLYVLLLGAIGFAARGLHARFPRGLTRADAMLLAAVVLYLLIPLMPDAINGAIDFFTRMLVMVWVLALFAASQYSLKARGRRMASIAAISFATLTLLPAESHFRAISQTLSEVDHLDLPHSAHGLILVLAGEPHTVPGFSVDLETNPMLWSSMVPMLHAHDVPINSPWMDVTYFPLRPGSDPKLLYNIVRTRQARESIDLHDGDLRRMAPAEQQRILQAADFVFALRHQADQVDLSSQLGSLSDAFRCSAHGWYLLCFPKASQSSAETALVGASVPPGATLPRR